MPDWTKSMQQSFEYYIVDPATWGDSQQLYNVKSCTINRDVDTETLGSATIDITESVGECYIRVYLITIQNGVKEKHPLGTFLVQTPSSSFDGKIRAVSMDAYTPLLELKENQPPIGYFIPKETANVATNIMDYAYTLVRDNVRAPVVPTVCTETLHNHFIANTEDTWITFVRDLIGYAKYDFDLDEMGRILFAPRQETSALQPVCTFDDGNSSILYPDLSMDHDLYGIPNVVEVVYSGRDVPYYSVVKNEDPNSPISIQNRGRPITRRITNPELTGNPTDLQIDEYAERALKEFSTLEYTVSYTHGYRPVRLRDCVRLNYTRAGLIDVKAKVVSQSIKCEPGCPVSEKAVFTTNLWR